MDPFIILLALPPGIMAVLIVLPLWRRRERIYNEAGEAPGVTVSQQHLHPTPGVVS